MSENRFEVDVTHALLVWDTEKNKRLEIEDIVDLLNEQQSTIQSKDKELERLYNLEIRWLICMQELIRLHNQCLGRHQGVQY